MRTYTAIIIEDERLPALSLIQKLQSHHPDIRVVDTCADCDTALESICRNRPDILFLDIQLSGNNSIWLLEQLREMMPLPHIIFTTAYNDPAFLIKAIKFSAVDYLLKPVNILELGKALQKIREREEQNGSAGTPSHPAKANPYTFRTLNGILYIAPEDIIYIRAEGNYSTLQLCKGEETIFERLGEIEAKLDKQYFLRTGRSFILNKGYIYKVDKKRNQCTMKTPDGKTYVIDISSGGMESILSL